MSDYDDTNGTLTETLFRFLIGYSQDIPGPSGIYRISIFDIPMTRHYVFSGGHYWDISKFPLQIQVSPHPICKYQGAVYFLGASSDNPLFERKQLPIDDLLEQICCFVEKSLEDWGDWQNILAHKTPTKEEESGPTTVRDFDEEGD